jgi:predicted trehalose synthase
VGQDQATTNSKNQATMIQALQKRLQERERSIAAQTQQIEVLYSQLEALKQIDQETHRQSRKGLTYPIP